MTVLANGSTSSAERYKVRCDGVLLSLDGCKYAACHQHANEVEVQQSELQDVLFTKHRQLTPHARQLTPTGQHLCYGRSVTCRVPSASPAASSLPVLLYATVVTPTRDALGVEGFTTVFCRMLWVSQILHTAKHSTAKQVSNNNTQIQPSSNHAFTTGVAHAKQQLIHI